jgi:hypothetical protein
MVAAFLVALDQASRHGNVLGPFALLDGYVRHGVVPEEGPKGSRSLEALDVDGGVELGIPVARSTWADWLKRG